MNGATQPVPQIPYRERDEIERQAEAVMHEIASPGAIWDAFDICHGLGVPVRIMDFNDMNILGKLNRMGSDAEIQVRAGDPYRRQNFTVAHELGHLKLHHLGSWADTRETMYRRAYWRGDSMTRRAEYQANLFAAALLMPEAIVRERWNLLNSPSYLAPFFRVSNKAMIRRLEELGIIVRSIEGFNYVELTNMIDEEKLGEPPSLSDDRGKIPAFQPIAVDEFGRIIPMSQDERKARQDALERVLNVASHPSRIDPPELSE